MNKLSEKLGDAVLWLQLTMLGMKDQDIKKIMSKKPVTKQQKSKNE